MKKINLLVFVFMSTFGYISAQNYQTVFQDRAIYFNNGSSQESARFDSVYDNPTQLIPFTIVRQIDTDCFSPLEPSRLGRFVILRENGYNDFITYTYDTIKIKTDALLNESWIFFRDSMYEVTASVSSISEESLFGVNDSVKNITLQFKDLNGVPVNHYFNDITIKLSKNYGLKQWFDFALFPNHETSASINLTGLTNPNVGLTNFTWFETFDFQPGDELHIYEEDRNPDYFYTRKFVYKYIERNDYNDSIKYYIDRESVIKNHYSNSITYTHDTIKQKISRNDPYDHYLPMEPYLNDYEIWYYFLDNSVTKSISDFSHFYPFEDSCFFETNPTWGHEFNAYLKGLGGPYYNNSYGVQYSYERSLIYYKKDGISYGTPFNLLGVDNQFEIQQSFTLFPNPAIDQVTISYHQEGIYTLEFVNLLGKLVQTETITNSGQTINISSLNSGMYLYRVKVGKNIIQTGKLIRL
jgi:hypothetical protein